MADLRVLHVTTSYPSWPDDTAGPFIYRLVEAQKNLDNALEIAVLTPAAKTPSDWQAGDVIRFRYAAWKRQTLAQLPGGIPVALRTSWKNKRLLPKFVAAMARAITKKGRDFDVIHAHWSISGFLAVMTQSFHHCPVVLTLRGSDHEKAKKGGIYAYIQRVAVTRSEYTVAVSVAMEIQLKQLYPEQAERISTIHNGVDETFYNVDGSQRPFFIPLKLLCVGNLISLKGQATILQALAQLHGEAWQLTLMGAGPDQTKLEAMAGKLRIADKVSFIGQIPPAEVAGEMQAHHVLISASHSEGRSNAVLEAQAAAMPVVVSDIPGNRELIEEGVNGWLFPVDDSGRLAELLTDLFRKPYTELEAEGQAGRHGLLRQELRWRSSASQYVELYEKAFEQEKAAACAA